METTTIIEEDDRIPFQFQIIGEHTLKPIRRDTEPISPEKSPGKFAEKQQLFEKKVSN